MIDEFDEPPKRNFKDEILQKYSLNLTPNEKLKMGNQPNKMFNMTNYGQKFMSKN